MGQRIIWGIVYGVVLIGTLLSGNAIALAILLSAITVLCMNEFFVMMTQALPSFQNRLSFYQSWGVYGGALVVLLGSLTFAGLVFPMFFYAACMLIYLPFLAELFAKEGDRNFLNIGIWGASLLYVVLPMLAANVIAYHNGHLQWQGLLGLFILIWTNDSMQYFTGKAIGKHPLYPSVSPKKTIEGAIGGVVFTTAAGYLLSIYWHCFDSKHWMLLAATTAVFGIIGDLIESVLKRQIGIKDSGKFLPGHGGALDRFDSLLIVTPLAALLLLMWP